MGLNFKDEDLNAIFLVGPHTQHKWHPDSKKVSDAFVLQARVSWNPGADGGSLCHLYGAV